MTELPAANRNAPPFACVQCILISNILNGYVRMKLFARLKRIDWWRFILQI
jgi:hypothetical protein